jgi:hypothetical protein
LYIRAADHTRHNTGHWWQTPVDGWIAVRGTLRPVILPQSHDRAAGFSSSRPRGEAEIEARLRLIWCAHTVGVSGSFSSRRWRCASGLEADVPSAARCERLDRHRQVQEQQPEVIPVSERRQVGVRAKLGQVVIARGDGLAQGGHGPVGGGRGVGGAETGRGGGGGRREQGVIAS